MKRVLLLEADPSEARFLTELFSSCGAGEFEIERVTNPTDGIHILRHTQRDVVLLDLKLESAAGMETLLRVREAAPEVAIVVLTSLDDGARASEALKNGAQDYLVKANLDRDVLFRAIRYSVERKRAETERRLLEQRLLESQKLEAIGRLAGGVAHNFNNMLTAILGRSELILEEGDSADHHHVLAIKRSAERAAILTRQLLTFSRKQNSGLQPMSLNELIAETRLLLESTVANEVTLEINFAPEATGVNGDKHQIGQLLMNLLTNASTALPLGGRCIIETATENEQVLLTVRDTGCGMSEETIGHIFEPFFSTKGIALAAGLGLSTVYGIVQQHGGTIDVKSKPGEGTAFLIRFPLLKLPSTGLLRGHECIRVEKASPGSTTNGKSTVNPDIVRA